MIIARLKSTLKAYLVKHEDLTFAKENEEWHKKHKSGQK
jgi:hypothetical protein